MKLKARHLLLLIVVTAAFAAGVWAVARFTLKRPSPAEPTAAAPRAADPDLWARSLEKIKEDRGNTGNVAIEIPAELRHYDERRWFLATQVAEVKKFNLQPVQDFVDLAASIRRGEMVPLSAVTDTYILFGVGARVNGDGFTRYVANQNLELNDEAGLRDAYAGLESVHSKLQKEISDLQAELNGLNNSAGTKQDELDSEIKAQQQELKSNEEDQALISQYYGLSSGSSGSDPKLFRDYDSLQALARDFGGRALNLDVSSDRQTLKVYLLSSLRPQALKVLEEIAKRYHDKFDRPLPVSSLVRPEQYQHLLRRVNRYAVVIDTPPHSTGLAFDIDYRYMSIAEQNFVMIELARMKIEGRIEVIRERGANYHVFAFLDGQRPSDDLINASLNEVGPPVKQRNDGDQAQSQQTSEIVRAKSRVAKNTRANSKMTRTASKANAKRHR
jgi:hypothetical protein